MLRETNEPIGQNVAPKISKDKIARERIRRKRRYIRKKLIDVLLKGRSLSTSSLDDPRYNGIHKDHNRNVRNLIIDLQRLSSTKEHQNHVRQIILELNLQSYCQREDP